MTTPVPGRDPDVSSTVPNGHRADAAVRPRARSIPTPVATSPAVDITAVHAAPDGSPCPVCGQRAERVPWRTIFAAVAVVLAVALMVVALRQLLTIIAWVVVAGFFAIVLNPAVDRLERRLGGRRNVATGLVFTVTVLVLAGLITLIVLPVARQAPSFLANWPGQVDGATEGRGSVGQLLERLHLLEFVRTREPQLRAVLDNAAGSSVRVVRGVFSTIIAIVTIIVLAFLFVIEGPRMLDTVERFFPRRQRPRFRRAATDSARAVSGYMVGNVFISVIAGVTSFVTLAVLGVPYSQLLAVWVAFADLIPLIGATLGASVCVLVALTHSTSAGIIAAIFFLVYQQFENHVLSVAVMSRTVRTNPLVVLLAVLAGVQLAGFVGAMLAIPAAGVIQVIGKEFWPKALIPALAETGALDGTEAGDEGHDEDPLVTDPEAAAEAETLDRP